MPAAATTRFRETKAECNRDAMQDQRTEQFARFAREWVKAWNDHDLEAILAHYADDVVFHSPRIRMVTGRDIDSVTGKTALRSYWGAALEQARDLYFEIDQVLTGSDAFTIFTPTIGNRPSPRLSCWRCRQGRQVNRRLRLDRWNGRRSFDP